MTVLKVGVLAFLSAMLGGLCAMVPAAAVTGSAVWIAVVASLGAVLVSLGGWCVFNSAGTSQPIRPDRPARPSPSPRSGPEGPQDFAGRPPRTGADGTAARR